MDIKINGVVITYGEIKKLERHTRTGDIEVVSIGDKRSDSGRAVQRIICTSDDSNESFIMVDANNRVIDQYIGGEFTVYYFGI